MFIEKNPQSYKLSSCGSFGLIFFNFIQVGFEVEICPPYFWQIYWSGGQIMSAAQCSKGGQLLQLQSVSCDGFLAPHCISRLVPT
jgi:hypothetical protein